MVSSPQKLGVTQSRSQSLRYLCPVLSRCFPCPLVQVLTSTNFTTPKLQKASQSSFKNSNQKKDMPISDLLVVARLERVAFGLSLASSSSSWIDESKKSLESSVPEPMASLSYSHFHPFHCCQRLPCCHSLSMCWHFSVLVGQLSEDSSACC